MGRINNDTLYPPDTLIDLDETLIGSDKNNAGKTKQYPIRSIIATIDNAIVQKFGNESEEGIENGYELIAEGVPIVAELDKLIFEYNDEQNVVLLKLVPQVIGYTLYRANLNKANDGSVAATQLSPDSLPEGVNIEYNATALLGTYTTVIKITGHPNNKVYVPQYKQDSSGYDDVIQTYRLEKLANEVNIILSFSDEDSQILTNFPFEVYFYN